MNHKAIFRSLFAGLSLLVVILDSSTALQGAEEGIALCVRTVIPSLFPFLFLCSILTNSLWGSPARFLRPLAGRMGIPSGAESLLVAGLLGGYPAGAQAVADAFRDGRLEKEDAAALLGYCSNAGPAFLFGIIAPQFPDRSAPWHLWAIQILSAALTGAWMARPQTSCQLAMRSDSVSHILSRSVTAMGQICGWIVLFRILFAFLNRWILWLLPSPLQVLITGLLELSNGCCRLSAIDSDSLRFLTASILLSAGGLCVLMQTASVSGSLPLRGYLIGKAMQTVFAAILSAVCLSWGPGTLLVPWIFLMLFPKKQKKRWISSRFRCIMPISPPGGKNHAVS